MCVCVVHVSSTSCLSQTHLTFGQEFTAAVENKQVAQQEAERSKFVVQKAEQEKQAAVIRAEGESQAAKLVRRLSSVLVPRKSILCVVFCCCFVLLCHVLCHVLCCV